MPIGTSVLDESRGSMEGYYLFCESYPSLLERALPCWKETDELP